VNWINVKDQLPERGVYVLAYSPGPPGLWMDVVQLVNADETQDPHWDDGDRWFDFDAFTYWMPLPPFPQEIP
jgi:hypothetical protein